MRRFPMLSTSWLSRVLRLTGVAGGGGCLNKVSSNASLRWKSTKKKRNKSKKSEKEEEPQQQPQDVLSGRSNSGHLILTQPRHLGDHAPEPSTNQLPLSPEQHALIDLILTGRNVFYTGAAGTGKSTVLRAAVERLRHLGRRVQVVAPTGRAALAVNGTTTWSYAGWTPSAHARPLNVLRQWSIDEKNIYRLAKTDVLVIDEISMVENHHLERLSEIMKEARGHADWDLGWDHVQNIRQSAFGGCQIIATGDFSQLPPVCPFQHCIECGSPLLKELRPGETTYRCPSGHGNWPDSYKWAFQSEVWDNARFAHVELRQVHRQAGDALFIKILNRVRSGKLTYHDVMVLTDPSRKTKDLTNAVRLYPTRSEVAQYNADKLRELKTPPYHFVARDSFLWNGAAHPHLRTHGERRADGTLAALREHKYEPFLRLKVGMPVVLVSNISISRGLVNGSQGVVIDFAPVDGGDILLHRKKSKAGPKSAYISNIIDDELFQYATSTQAIRALPVVRFDNGVKQVIHPDCWDHEVGNEALSANTELDTYSRDMDKFLRRPAPSVLCRTQIPLIAGWAMSIHKAQGMTLGKVIVDLTRAFEEGQVYVALSRARSLDGLKIEGDPRGLSESPQPRPGSGSLIGPVLVMERSCPGTQAAIAANELGQLVVSYNVLLPDAFAENRATIADCALKSPDGIAFEIAATLGISIATIGYALFRALNIQVNQMSLTKPAYGLVYCGSTATETMAMRVIRRSGLIPITTCSPRNFAVVEGYGAEKAFDYHDPETANAVRTYTKNTLSYALDCVCEGSSMKFCYAAIGRAGGSYTTRESYLEHMHTRKRVMPEWLLGPALMGKEAPWKEPHYIKGDPELQVLGGMVLVRSASIR
ncbi:hypothetical protein DL764_002408 [Monosporascus ibericus]|uniref:ATP-dependent DNA helicase n=1 Tax=Monosporascus ibericus TaxID=155417 RepID=A0A4Q4TKH4_9PEZI|nr:hypothetical protein DL764_002408 [Monosporascus ibericus]